MPRIVFHKIPVYFHALLYALIFIFIACSNPYKNFTKTEYSEKSTKIIPYLLPSIEKTIIYKADFTFYKNKFGGLLVIKKVSESSYRLALTTQFGLKIFDFELTHGKLNVVYCIDQLNRNVILKMLEDDFNLLLLQVEYQNIISLKNSSQNQHIYQLTSGNTNYYYIQNNNSESIDHISKRKRNSEKISVGLHNYYKNVPGEIILKHHGIKHSLNLKLLQ